MYLVNIHLSVYQSGRYACLDWQMYLFLCMHVQDEYLLGWVSNNFNKPAMDDCPACGNRCKISSQELKRLHEVIRCNLLFTIIRYDVVLCCQWVKMYIE